MTKTDLIQQVEEIFGNDVIDFSKVPNKFSKKDLLNLKCVIHNKEFTQSPCSLLNSKKLNCMECINKKYQDKLDNYLNTHKISKEVL